MESPERVTQLLVDWSNGDKSALDKLMPVVYDELRRLASNYLRRERAGHTLQPTALVNEAYLRLVDQRQGRRPQSAESIAVAAPTLSPVLARSTRAPTGHKSPGAA